LRPLLSVAPALPLADVVVAFVPASPVALSGGGVAGVVAFASDAAGATAAEADAGAAVVDADDDASAEGVAEAGDATVAFTSGAALVVGRLASLGGELRTA
jgi:hypothetical protein